MDSRIEQNLVRIGIANAGQYGMVVYQNANLFAAVPARKLTKTSRRELRRENVHPESIPGDTCIVTPAHNVHLRHLLVVANVQARLVIQQE